MSHAIELSNVGKTLELIRSFPTLRQFADDFDIDAISDSSEFSEAFAKWAVGPHMTNASREAARFVLAVWNGWTPCDAWWCEGEFSVGKFDAVRAIGCWDSVHRDAFLAWCQDPFWP
jgi:hypothetical protein